MPNHFKLNFFKYFLMYFDTMWDGLSAPIIQQPTGKTPDAQFVLVPQYIYSTRFPLFST